jgi:hypothetical protein
MLKKAVLSALLLAVAVVATASADLDYDDNGVPYIPPYANLPYSCSYTGNSGIAANPGTSIFAITAGQLGEFRKWDGYEWFDAIRNGVKYRDSRKVIFTKPVNGSDFRGDFTQWEFTINPYGPQCKGTKVYYGGAMIRFTNCTDGHTRTCYLQ